MDDAKESWVYRLYCTKSQDHSGELLYVGISDSPSSRMGNHESQKWWWWLVDRVEWIRCFDRRHAEAEESRAIASERPLFNRAESNLCAWERLQDLVYLLWAHEDNQSNLVVCPFCDSHGSDEFLSPSDTCDLFRRNEDDRIVIHFVVECDRHRQLIRWAVHIHVQEFLCRHKVPALVVERLVTEAIQTGNVPFEHRMQRESTLCEKLDAGGCVLASRENMTLIEAQ